MLLGAFTSKGFLRELFTEEKTFWTLNQFKAVNADYMEIAEVILSGLEIV